VNGDTFTPGKPRLWSTQQISISAGGQNMDLAPDGKHLAILLAQPASAEQRASGVKILLNFFDDLRQRAPARGK
jgi:hypothetical protein